jgi:spore coat protein CotH
MKKFYYLLGLSAIFTIGLFAQVPQYGVTMAPADYDSLYTRDIWSDVFLNSPFKSHDTIWSGATIHFKGHSTRYYPKKAYRVRFKTSNLYHGLRDVNFNPMYTDKSNIREKLAWDLFADMKAVAPFCYHANFSINGESKGLFSFIDKINKYFLTTRGLTLGNLYY